LIRQIAHFKEIQSRKTLDILFNRMQVFHQDLPQLVKTVRRILEIRTLLIEEAKTKRNNQNEKDQKNDEKDDENDEKDEKDDDDDDDDDDEGTSSTSNSTNSSINTIKKKATAVALEIKLQEIPQMDRVETFLKNLLSNKKKLDQNLLSNVKRIVHLLEAETNAEATKRASTSMSLIARAASFTWRNFTLLEASASNSVVIEKSQQSSIPTAEQASTSTRESLLFIDEPTVYDGGNLTKTKSFDIDEERNHVSIDETQSDAGSEPEYFDCFPFSPSNQLTSYENKNNKSIDNDSFFDRTTSMTNQTTGNPLLDDWSTSFFRRKNIWGVAPPRNSKTIHISKYSRKAVVEHNRRNRSNSRGLLTLINNYLE
jgi:hypothetical protein